MTINLNNTYTIDECVEISLMTDRGFWWADPSLGSKIHTLKRNKLNRQTLILAKQYAEESLNWLLVDGIANVIDVTTLIYNQDSLKILVDIYLLNESANLKREFILKWRH